VRIVLDTNVLLSAVLKVGVCNRIVNASTEHAVFEIVTTGKQLQELRDVMLRPAFKFGFMPAHADGYLSILYNQSEFIETVPSIPAMTRDANDEYLVALAVHASVDALVSDDNHLLELQEIPGKDRAIPVRTSRQFLTFLEKNNLLE
jgi:uncharacterized protein